MRSFPCIEQSIPFIIHQNSPDGVTQKMMTQGQQLPNHRPRMRKKKSSLSSLVTRESRIPRNREKQQLITTNIPRTRRSSDTNIPKTRKSWCFNIPRTRKMAANYNIPRTIKQPSICSITWLSPETLSSLWVAWPRITY